MTTIPADPHTMSAFLIRAIRRHMVNVEIYPELTEYHLRLVATCTDPVGAVGAKYEIEWREVARMVNDARENMAPALLVSSDDSAPPAGPDIFAANLYAETAEIARWLAASLGMARYLAGMGRNK